MAAPKQTKPFVPSESFTEGTIITAQLGNANFGFNPEQKQGLLGGFYTSDGSGKNYVLDITNFTVFRKHASTYDINSAYAMQSPVPAEITMAAGSGTIAAPATGYVRIISALAGTNDTVAANWDVYVSVGGSDYYIGESKASAAVKFAPILKDVNGGRPIILKAGMSLTIEDSDYVGGHTNIAYYIYQDVAV